MVEKSSAVTKYEQARQALEEYFIQYGTFTTLSELLEHRYGTDWLHIFDPDATDSDDDKVHNPLRDELMDLCFKISQAWIQYCRRYNKLYRKVKTIISVITNPEVLYPWLPDKLDNMDLYFLMQYCPPSMFLWILTRWTNIVYENNMKSLLITCDKFPDMDFVYHDDYIDLIDNVRGSSVLDNGYLSPIIDFTLYDQDTIDKLYTRNIIYGKDVNPANIYLAIKYGLPFEDLLADTVQKQINTITDIEFRRYFPLIKDNTSKFQSYHTVIIINNVRVNMLLHTATSVDKLFVILSNFKDSIDMDKLVREITYDASERKLVMMLALHFIGVDPLQLYRVYQIYFNLYYGYHHTMFDETEDQALADFRLSKPKNFSKINVSKSNIEELKSLVTQTKDTKIKNYINNYDLFRDLRNYFDRNGYKSNWYELPQEIKDVYYTLELLRTTTDSLYSMLPRELTDEIFSYAYLDF